MKKIYSASTITGGVAVSRQPISDLIHADDALISVSRNNLESFHAPLTYTARYRGMVITGQRARRLHKALTRMIYA